ncbi:hypothetical protein Patl1_19088 [Pistacia atlantica]|uniref:Uncharacterized protein n=1 Tax=Pistacia atlantica TaxID=434234 RepID=A0ACC1BYG4_9ROSI|nr:hypothetical protein Patl1_19088 [Pistacia atlantica]
MEDLDAVSESPAQTEKQDDKSKSPETELPQPPDSNPTENEDDNSKLPETELPQPPESNPTGQPAEAWKSGLCACCNNPCNGDTLSLSLSLSLSNSVALVTVFFPCVTFGQVAEMVDEGNIMQWFTWCCAYSAFVEYVNSHPFTENSGSFNPEALILVLVGRETKNKQLSMRPPTTQRMTN